MTTFKYAAKDPTGKTVEGTIQANDKNERLYEPPTPGDQRLRRLRGRALRDREYTTTSPGGAL